jgi:hypothetical protein
LAFTGAMAPIITTMREIELQIEGGIEFAFILKTQLKKLAHSGDNLMITTDTF